MRQILKRSALVGSEGRSMEVSGENRHLGARYFELFIIYNHRLKWLYNASQVSVAKVRLRLMLKSAAAFFMVVQASQGHCQHFAF